MDNQFNSEVVLPAAKELIYAATNSRQRFAEPSMSDEVSEPARRPTHQDLLNYHRAKPDWNAALRPDIVVVPNAIVAPVSRTSRNHLGMQIQDSAVYFSDGTVCEQSLHRAGPLSDDNIAGPCPADLGSVAEGTFLFGGLLVGHFGHFLMECLGRLWALAQAHDIRSVVFIRGERIPGHLRSDGTEHIHVHGYIQETLRLLKVSSLEIVSSSPKRFERLLVPNQLFGFSRSEGHPSFHEFVHGLRGVQDKSLNAKMVYVSRAGMGEQGGGGMLCERVLEENFASYGYSIMRPENISVEKQLHYYNAADTLVFSEGSGLHLYGFVARPDQRVLIVKRRPYGIPEAVSQLQSFGSPHLREANFILSHVTRKGARDYAAALQTGLSRIDFAALGDFLAEIDFIPDTKSWRCPTAEEEALEGQDLMMTRAL